MSFDIEFEFARFRTAKDKASDKRFSNKYATTPTHFRCATRQPLRACGRCKVKKIFLLLQIFRGKLFAPRTLAHYSVCLLVAHAEECAVERAAVAEQGIAVVAVNQGAGLQIVGALAGVAEDVLAVLFRPGQCAHAGAVGTDAVVGHETVEIGHTHDEAYRIVGSQQIGGVADFLVGTDDVVLDGHLRVVALCIDVANAFFVDLRGDEDIAAG